MPNVTSGPGTAVETPTSPWSDREATNAPGGDPSVISEGYASSTPELFDRLLHGGRPLGLSMVATLLILAWFCFLSYMFLQDNGAGKLDSVGGLWAFGVKALAYSGVAGFSGLAILAVTLIHNHLRK